MKKIMSVCAVLFLSLAPGLRAGDFMFSRLEENCSVGNFPTFGSFNVHLAEIKGAYYAAYMTRDAMSNPAYVRIKRSTDGGKTWELFYTGTNGSVDHTELPPVIAADKEGRLHMVWADSGYGHYARFSGHPLKSIPDIVRADMGQCNSKWAMVYNPVRDVLHWSRRDWATNLHILTLDTTGKILSDTEVVRGVGAWSDSGAEHWDAHYQALSVDPHGRLHMVYNPHFWPADRNAPYERVRVQYIYSDDGGQTWKNAAGRNLSLPVLANQVGKDSGTVINLPTESGISVESLLATSNHVHVLYWSTSANISKYVRMNRSTGVVEKNVGLSLRDGTWQMHTSFVEDPIRAKLYLVGDKRTSTGSYVVNLQESSDNGDTWKDVFITNPRPAKHGQYFAGTTYPQITSDGAIMGMTTDCGTGDQKSDVDPIWFKYVVAEKIHY